MKIRTEPRSKNLVVEMQPQERELPPIALPSFQLKKILLPVDFSQTSHKALAYAVSFAKQFSAQVLLLHIIEPFPITEVEAMPIDDIGNVWEDCARELAIWQDEFHSQASVQTLLRQGNARHEIIEAARDSNIDLILMGTHRRKGVAHLFGSTAEWVVRHAPCPVMVVREYEHDFVRTV